MPHGAGRVKQERMASLFSRRSPGASRPGLLARLVRAFLLVCLLLFAALALVTLAGRFLPPASTLMLWRWVTFQPVERTWVPLDAISPRLQRAVVLAEDARFCQHSGIDWQALQSVIEEADEDGPARGASTITMQTAKNLFLWHGRSYVRKGLELPLALWLELVWPKHRVLEVYLNIAEWGEGVFGAEAGAQAAFRKSARELSFREAALMARALPNPVARSAGRPTARQEGRARSLVGRLSRETADLSCLPE